MFNGNVVVTGGNFIINDAQSATQRILQTFGENYVPSATYDGDNDLYLPNCCPGTRITFLTRLSNWAADTESFVYLTWLHGPVGAGKSVIARSLARSLDSKGLLAGSFFIFKTDSRRNWERPFVMTLSYQISRSIPDTLPYIEKIVQEDPTVTSMSLEIQFKKLVIEPLVQIINDESISLRPMLIIIDGLDECVEQRSRSLILKVIFNALPYLHGHIKFLVVSRPEYDIQRSFDSVAATLGEWVNTVEVQGDLEAYGDVRTYLEGSFYRIKQSHPQHFPPDWPSADAIDRLVEKSSGHFLFASTVMRYIEDDTDLAQKRLDIIVNLRSPTTWENPYAVLDAPYFDILTSARADHALLINILSIVVLDLQIDKTDHWDLDTMKSVHFIESVLCLQPGEVQLALRDLRSLAVAEETIEFWQESFFDFLLDPSRSRQFYSSSASAYTLIAKGCLRLLSDQTGSLESTWSNVTCNYPTSTLKCHHLLSLCCKRAVVDLDLQTAMMEYNFNVIPPDVVYDNRAPYFSVFSSCLHNYQQTSIFEGTKVVERLHVQFDNYLISELRRFVPLDSEIMNILRTTISPLGELDRKTYRAHQSGQMDGYNFSFLHYLCDEGFHDDILCEFFYSEDRACEYYLGESQKRRSLFSFLSNFGKAF